MRIENFQLDISKALDLHKTKSIDSPSGFGDILKDLISGAGGLREKDVVNNKLLATGQVESLDRVMIDMEKADIALQFTMQIRNKILDAYQEIMRMQI